MNTIKDTFKIGDDVIIPGVYNEPWKCHARIVDITSIDPDKELIKIVVNRVTDPLGRYIDPSIYGYTTFLLCETMEVEYNSQNPIRISKDDSPQPLNEYPKTTEGEYKQWLNRYFDISKHDFPSIYYSYYNQEEFEACKEYVSKFCKLRKNFGNFTPSPTRRQKQLNQILK